MKEQIKELRIKIDGLSQLVEGLYGSQLYLMDIENIPKGMSIRDYIRSYTEMYKCYDSLILAKAWLGKVLGELAEATPYANDGNRKTVEDIESAVDKAVDIRDPYGIAMFINKKTGNPITTDTPEWLKMSHIEKVDWLREEIKHLLKFYIDLHPEEVRNDNKHPNIHYYKLYYKKCLEEARFWLGFGLQRIKENK